MFRNTSCDWGIFRPLTYTPFKLNSSKIDVLVGVLWIVAWCFAIPAGDNTISQEPLLPIEMFPLDSG